MVTRLLGLSELPDQSVSSLHLPSAVGLGVRQGCWEWDEGLDSAFQSEI